MRLILLFTFISFLKLSAQDFYIRFNQAGYKTTGPKSIIINSTKDIRGKEWHITKGEEVVISGKIGESKSGKGKHSNFDFNYKIDFSNLNKNADYSFSVGEQKIKFKIEEQPYQKFLSEVLRYLRQQRSGTTTVIDKPAGHFGDSSAIIYHQVGKEMKWEEDTKKTKTNVIGGWYDAGDYLKFTLTNAYTTYLLLSAYEANPKAFDFKINSSSELNDLLDEAKWGLDYLEKCLVNDSTFVFQVGDHRDHNLGNRLPNKDTNPHRYAYTSMSRPQLAYNSAALAIGARVFASIDSSLSKKYLNQAIKLFELASKHKKCFWFQKDHEVFYADKNGYDNIQLAAAELYQSTKNDKYIQEIQYYCTMTGVGYWASWADFNMITHARSSKVHPKSLNYLESDLKGFRKIQNEPTNIWNVPHAYTWGTLYNFFGVANGALLHGDLVEQSEFKVIPYDVIDYTFGKNNWGVSFLASKYLPNAVKNIYSQTYILQKNLFPTGAIAEGPGEKKDHLEMVKWFNLSQESLNAEKFNTEAAVFYDDATDFQTMETTISGLADGIFLLSLMSR